MNSITADIESPGFEYLRAYQSMNNLYHKLILLDYRGDFCVKYKCPAINRYYFAIPNKNQTEQQFIFTCLCAWLIKYKCQMNVDLEPENYQDPDVTVSLILESLRLVVSADISNSFIRLKQGYGPEAICALNILADMSLELRNRNSPPDMGPTKVIYTNSKGNQDSRYITIGQPFVGGGLTTRPLGSYKIDDTSLLFPPDELDESQHEKDRDASRSENNINPDEWLAMAESSNDMLVSAIMVSERTKYIDTSSRIALLSRARLSLDQFEKQSKTVIDILRSRMNSQMDSIIKLEGSISDALGDRIERFVELQTKVDKMSDQSSALDRELHNVNNDIKSRTRELNDSTKLERLKYETSRLRTENGEMDWKIGLLLTVYAKRHEDILAQSRDLTSVKSIK